MLHTTPGTAKNKKNSHLSTLLSLPRPRSKLFTVLYNMGHDGYNDLWSVALPYTVNMAAHSVDVTCIYIIYLNYLSING